MFGKVDGFLWVFQGMTFLGLWWIWVGKVFALPASFFFFLVIMDSKFVNVCNYVSCCDFLFNKKYITSLGTFGWGIFWDEFEPLRWFESSVLFKRDFLFYFYFLF